jgi:hypothetical protein
MIASTKEKRPAMLLYFLGAFIVTVIVGSWIMAGLLIKWTEGDD